MTRRAPPPKDEVVIRAWRRTGGPVPAAVERMGQRRSRKSVLFRLAGAGEAGRSVVAKLCRGPHARTERRIYEDVLPKLGLPLPRYYGSIEEPEGVWLFLTDGGSTRCDANLPEHRALAARWLASMHRAAIGKPLADLPDRGPDHHRSLLRKTRGIMLDNMGNPAFDAGHRAMLDALVQDLDGLEARWNELDDVCSELPRTLVHGDFCTKNLHVVSGPQGQELFPMDWEMAGVGVPACDMLLSRRASQRRLICDLDVYGAGMREHWPALDHALLRRTAALGLVFRSLAGMDWACVDLHERWPEKPIPKLRVYRRDLHNALRNLACAA